MVNATLSPLRIALADAPLPPPPIRETAGSLVYPEPREVTVMTVTYPAVTVAVALACSPADNRPNKFNTKNKTVTFFIQTVRYAN
jgi:hypothetical protein